jgi:25S rRNA (uracil2634-N3)-methyltransferase
MALTATTFESRASLLEKYPQAVSTLASLAAASHTILFSTDATKLGQPHTPGGAALRKARFDAVVFNFPHVGGKSTDVNRQVRANQALVVGFLERAMGLLAEGGRVVLSIFEGQPYELWGVRNLARHVGLKVERSMKFDAMLYPGYSHARTLGNVEGGGGWKGEDRRARMFVFMKEGEVPREGGKKTVDSNEDDEEE